MTASIKTTLKPGDVLNDKWVVLQFIGKGGMGEVYRAHQLNLNRDVALKIASEEFLNSLEESPEEIEIVLQRFRREVQTMAQIRHPNVIQIYDEGAAVIHTDGKDKPSSPGHGICRERFAARYHVGAGVLSR